MAPVATTVVLLIASNIFKYNRNFAWAGLCLLGAVFFLFRAS
jgi:uncharacterized protein (DUF486 family)